MKCFIHKQLSLDLGRLRGPTRFSRLVTCDVFINVEELPRMPLSDDMSQYDLALSDNARHHCSLAQ